MVYSKSSHEYEKMFKEEESIEILNIFGLSNKTEYQIGCVSIFTFASLFGIPIWITSSAMGLKICAITAGIKKHSSIFKKKKKKDDKIVL